MELEKLLRDRLPNNELAAPLFDLLVIKRELAKETLTKEGGDREKGAADALKDLIDLFKQK